MIKTVTCMCPSCGATINYNKRDEFEFCTYCGAKVFFDDGVLRFESTENINYNRTDRQIDEARIQESVSRADIERERLAYKKEKDKNETKLAIIVLAIMFPLILIPTFISICSTSIEDKQKSQQVVQADEVKMTMSAYQYEGEFYEGIVASLKGMGFEDIEIIPMGDITYEHDSDLNTIESISIAGDFKFSKYDIFKKTDKVVITYHSLKKKAESSQ